MSLAAAISHLQAIDLELDEIDKQAHLVREHLAGDPALVAARVSLESRQKHLNELRATVRDGELEAKTLDDKIAAINQRLYSGRIVNPKELDGLEKELQMHKRQRSLVDDRLLELLEQIDPVQAAVESQTKALALQDETRALEIGRLSREQEHLAARLAALTADHDRTRAALSSETLRTYDRLRKIKTGHAVTVIRHAACGQCGVAVPTGLVQRVHAGEELVFCSGCGRILAG